MGKRGHLKDKIRVSFPQGVDKVLELIGTLTLKDSMECLKRGGTACMTGMLSETWTIPDFAPMEFIPATVHLPIFDSGQIRSAVHVFREFLNSIEYSQVQLKPARVFKLNDIIEAHKCMANNLTDGKIVILTE